MAKPGSSHRPESVGERPATVGKRTERVGCGQEHPGGAHVASEMERDDHKLVLLILCIGGGQGVAMLLDRD